MKLRIDPALGFETVDGQGHRIVPGVFKSAAGTALDQQATGAHLNANDFSFTVPSTGNVSGEISDWLLVLTVQGQSRGDSSLFVSELALGPDEPHVLVTTSWAGSASEPQQGSPLGEDKHHAKAWSQIVAAPSGESFVAWAQEELDGPTPSWSIRGQRVTSDGWPQGPEWAVLAGPSSLLGYSVAHTGNDIYLVAWLERSSDGQLVVRASVRSEGVDIGDPLILDEDGSLTRISRPRLACADGYCVVGWLRYDEALGDWSLEVARVDALGSLLDRFSTRLHRPTEGRWLLPVSVLADSRVQILWEERSLTEHARSIWAMTMDPRVGPPSAPSRVH